MTEVAHGAERTTESVGTAEETRSAFSRIDAAVEEIAASAADLARTAAHLGDLVGRFQV